jgi:hypothetical protein
MPWDNTPLPKQLSRLVSCFLRFLFPYLQNGSLGARGISSFSNVPLGRRTIKTRRTCYTAVLKKAFHAATPSEKANLWHLFPLESAHSPL